MAKVPENQALRGVIFGLFAVLGRGRSTSEARPEAVQEFMDLAVGWVQDFARTRIDVFKDPKRTSPALEWGISEHAVIV